MVLLLIVFVLSLSLSRFEPFSPLDAAYYTKNGFGLQGGVLIFFKKVFLLELQHFFYALANVVDTTFSQFDFNGMANGQNINAQGVSDAELAEAAMSPASFSIEGLSQTNRSLSEIIAFDKYQRGKKLVSHCGSPLAGLISHAIIPGPTGRF